MTTIICEFCESCISKHNISKHKKSDTCIKIQNIINKHTISYNLLKCENDTLKNTIYSFEKDIENYKNQIKILEKSSEEYRKIVEKAATKTTVKNYNHNNYLNYISSEPLKLSEVKKQVKSIMNCDTVMLDDNEFNEHIVDNILKDENGKDKVLCTDINRKNFTYKDEKSGQLVCDPELERIREQLRKGADVKSLKKNLLEKLVKEYEDNNNTGIDPYKKFCDIIQKLNFGSPFVDHVAKKTYIKSKNYKDKEQSYSILIDNKFTNK
jgi:hypothetical protein